MARTAPSPPIGPSPTRRRWFTSAVVAGLVVGLLALAPAPADAATSTAVMRPARATAEQLAAWFRARSPGGYRATVPLDTLVAHFLDEGAAQGVSGDVAFVQSIVETGYFRFPDTGQVRPSDNNFSGLGAVDAGGGSQVARFATAQLGVRAQIQHLWAYADPAADGDRTARPLVDPRFDLVSPKGKAPTWNQFGGGNWATDPDYAAKILGLYEDLLDFARIRTGRFVASLYRDFLGREPDAGGLAFWTGQVAVRGRAEVALAIARQPEYLAKVITGLYLQALGRAPDRAGLDHWVGRVRRGLAVTEVAIALLGSAESYASGGGTNAGYVASLYRRVLGRAPDPGGSAHWTDRLDRGLSRPVDVARALYQSTESRQTRVVGLYRALLRRDPDPAGLAYWTGQLATREDVTLAASLAGSAEYFARAQR